MEKDILSELENASSYEYINLLPKAKNNMNEVSKQAEQIFVNSFRFELSEVVKED